MAERLTPKDETTLLWVFKQLLTDDGVYVKVTEHLSLVIDGRIDLSDEEADLIQRFLDLSQ